jgi:hypothetical protein
MDTQGNFQAPCQAVAERAYCYFSMAWSRESTAAQFLARRQWQNIGQRA